MMVCLTAAVDNGEENNVGPLKVIHSYCHGDGNHGNNYGDDDAAALAPDGPAVSPGGHLVVWLGYCIH